MKEFTFWGLFILLLGSYFFEVNQFSDHREDSFSVVDCINHGSPVDTARPRGIVATENQEGEAMIVSWISDSKEVSLLLIDPETGETEQFWPTPAIVSGIFSFLLSDAEHFYAYGDSHLLVFDINKREWLAILKGPRQFGHSFAEADDGTVYMGLYPDGHLLGFDPDTKELTNYGPLTNANVSLYPLHLAADREGWLYVGFRGQDIIAFDPATQTSKSLVEEPDYSGGGASTVFRAEDGYVYGRPIRGGTWYRYLEGKREILEGDPNAAPKNIITGNQEEAFTNFPDGRVIEEISIPKGYAEITYPNTKSASDTIVVGDGRIEFSYEAEGPRILSIGMGSDGLIYGSTGHPRYLFGFDPKKKSFKSIHLEGGHLNAITTQGDYLFGALYTGGELHQLDLREPWDANGHNPRVVAWARDKGGMINRPYVLLAHPDGQRIIMGGYHDWSGRAGGGLVIYNMDTEEVQYLSIDDLLDGHSAMSMVAFSDGTILVGTTVGTRGRAEKIAEEATLYRFDPDSQTILSKITPFSGVQHIRDLLRLPGGELVMGVADNGVLFVYDIANETIIHKENLSKYGNLALSQGPRVMAEGPDGKIYILFRRNIVQVDPKTFSHSSIGQTPVTIHTGIVIREDRLYFTHLSTLWSCELESEF